MNSIKELFKKYKEIIMYLIMGGLTTLVNWVVYSVSISFFRPGTSISQWLSNTFHISSDANTIDIFIANVLSWVLAVTFAYITNKIWVFQSRSWKPKFVLRELGLFVSARFITGLLEIFGVPFLVKHGFDQKIFGLDGSVCKITVCIFVVLLNYVFSKLFIFKKNEVSTDEALEDSISDDEISE